MQSSIRATSKTNRTSSSRSLLNSNFRKGYKTDLIPYQEGILIRSLWPSRSQVIRIIPGYDPATGEVFRQNVNVNDYDDTESYTNYLSNTFNMASTVSKFGSIEAPLITDYEPGSPDEQQWGGETVLRNFIRDIVYACSEKGSRRFKNVPQEWRMWTNRMSGGTLVIDHQSLLMQTLAYVINGKSNTDWKTGTELVDENGETLPMLALVVLDNKSSISMLCNELVKPINRALPLDAATNNSLGPMAELEGNKLFLNPVKDDSGFNLLKPSVQAEPKGWTPTPCPLGEDDVRELWHPWQDLLCYMTAEEQLRLCADEYGADTVNYVIGTNPKLAMLRIPEDIKAKGLGRYANINATSVSFGGYAAPQAPTSQQPAAPRSTGLGRRPSSLVQPQAAPAAEAPAPAIKPPTASTIGRRSALGGVQRSAAIDDEKLAATLARIRSAAKVSDEDSQAADASDLLDDQPLLQ